MFHSELHPAARVVLGVAAFAALVPGFVIYHVLVGVIDDQVAFLVAVAVGAAVFVEGALLTERAARHLADRGRAG